MFDQIFSQIRAVISGIIIGATSLLGIQKTITPNVPQQELIEEAAPELIPVATPSATPSIKLKPSLTPTLTLSPETTMDLNLEGVTLIPEKIEGNEHDSIEALQKRYSLLSTENLTFKQSNKIKEMYFRIRNNGHEDAIKVVINVIVDGQSLKEFTIDEIKQQTVKNETKQLDFPSKFGKHKIELQVNPSKIFPETRLDNNTKIIEYDYID